MYLDSQLQFSDSQALTNTTISDNVIDLGVDQDIGKGEPMGVVINVEVAADIADANETYEFQLVTDNDVAFGSPNTIVSVETVAADLIAGYILVIPVGHVNDRYLRLNFVLAGTTPSITISAFLQPMSMIDGKKDYADGFDIT